MNYCIDSIFANNSWTWIEDYDKSFGLKDFGYKLKYEDPFQKESELEISSPINLVEFSNDNKIINLIIEELFKKTKKFY